MFLAFKFSDIVTVPFGWLLSVLYDFTNNYGLALIFFAVIVKVILLPLTAKGKKNSMKMSRLQPRLSEIQQKYAGDQVKMNEEMQALYKRENVSMGGGCLWSFIPLLILFPLYNVVRGPIQYMLGESAEVAAQIIEIIKTNAPEAFTKNAYYDQMIAAPMIKDFVEQIKEVLPNISPDTLQGVNFDFFGINLAANPQWKVWADTWAWDWPHIGALLIPVLSAGSQMVSMLVSQKMNNSVITNEKGLEDKEAAKKSQANQSMKMMMYTMPLMSLYIGFTFPAAMSLYWLIQGLVSMVIDVILTSRYRKIYDAEDAIRLEQALEQERLEAEKERIRAERRAANPDGITDNTSKKKLQQKQKNEQQAAKAAAAKEYAAKKGLPAEEPEAEEKKALSGIQDRPNCKGRAYDPNRYRSQSTEE
jgi:YidC/Oxa1 family membrane protein insertase